MIEERVTRSAVVLPLSHLSLNVLKGSFGDVYSVHVLYVAVTGSCIIVVLCLYDCMNIHHQLAQIVQHIDRCGGGIILPSAWYEVLFLGWKLLDHTLVEHKMKKGKAT